MSTSPEAAGEDTEPLPLDYNPYAPPVAEPVPRRKGGPRVDYVGVGWIVLYVMLNLWALFADLATFLGDASATATWPDGLPPSSASSGSDEGGRGSPSTRRARSPASVSELWVRCSSISYPSFSSFGSSKPRLPSRTA
jgi:hypothetical protein